tara:strand:+ start:1526 stop:2479 length:954 start_codon:yes stop_codon:yes gene_type:complete
MITITKEVHNAFITTIIKYAEDSEINIYDLLRKLISDINWILLPNGLQLLTEDGNILLPKEAYNRHIKNKYGYFTFCNKGSHKKGNIIDWFSYLDKSKEWNNWNNITWYDMLIYLLFIQTNCHHKGHFNSSKLCNSSNSFYDFFYKSKNGFNPMRYWDSNFKGNQYIKIRESIKKPIYLAEWWIEVFNRDKIKLLLFSDLSPSLPNLKYRKTTGWTIPNKDRFPFMGIVNIIRAINNIHLLDSDYVFGRCIEKQTQKEYRFTIDDNIYYNNIDNIDDIYNIYNIDDIDNIHNTTILLVQCFISSFSFGLWFSKFIKK